MTDKVFLNNLRIPTSYNPLRILMSSCLLGTLCGADGSSYGEYPQIKTLASYSNISITSFCPEDYSFGTPRAIPDIIGGNGADVLDGKAIVETETGKDITQGMLEAASKMLDIALKNNIELAILMDVSAACGSQVIYKGHRTSKESQYQIGMGVCAELLNRNGIKIISQRDFKSLEILFSKVDTNHQIDKKAIDHDESSWFKQYFKI